MIYIRLEPEVICPLSRCGLYPQSKTLKTMVKWKKRPTGEVLVGGLMVCGGA